MQLSLSEFIITIRKLKITEVKEDPLRSKSPREWSVMSVCYLALQVKSISVFNPKFPVKAVTFSIYSNRSHL